MEIKGFIESSLLEWEGKISSVIFLPRCNLRCHYCHAGHLIIHPERTESIPRERVLGYMRRQSAWLDGAAITGGEPTLHGEELLDLIREIRALRLQVMVETNGTRPEWIGRLINEGLVEALAMDVKAPLTAEDYRRVCDVDVDVEDVRRSIDLVKGSGLPHEFRITLVPGLVGEDELRRIMPDLQGARQIALQNFQPEHCLSAELRDVIPYAPEELTAFERITAPVARRCVVRGRDHAALARSRQG